MNLHFRSLAAAALSLVLSTPHGVLLAQTAAPQQSAPAETSAPATSSAPQAVPAAPDAAATAPAATSLPTAPAAPAAADLATTPTQPGTATPPAGTIPAHMLPHDLTPWQMFLDADMVVKSVMIGLLIASIVTWTVQVARRRRATIREGQGSGSTAGARGRA